MNATHRLLFFVTIFFLFLVTSISSVSAYTNGSIASTVKINDITQNGPGTLLAGDQYGQDVANIGDLDGDGINDVLVGSNGNDTEGQNKGAAYIHFMNFDGTIKSTVKISEESINGATLAISDFYGVAVEGIGDLNNDGVPDIAIGANADDTGGAANTNRGAWYIHYMNRDGSVISTVKISVNTPNGPTGLLLNDRYGFRIINLGDLDDDGINDIAVPATRDDTGGTDRGAVYIHYMNRDGSIKSTIKIAHGTPNGATLMDGDRYGNGLANIGDLDNDGINDIAVGTWADDTGGTDRGAFYIHYMNRDGSIKSTVKIAHGTPNGATLMNGDYYGNEITNMGDLDADGVNEIVVGVERDDTGGTDRGAVYIHYMNRDGSIKSSVKITSSSTNGPQLINSDYYSAGIANLGDLNNDGSNDMAVTAFADASFKGAWYIHFLTPTPGVSVSKSTLSTTEDGATDSFTIRLNSKPTNTVTIALGLTTSQVSLNTSTLTFTPSDWAIPQTVTVTAVDDIDIEEVQSDTITVTTTSDDTLYNALSISSVIARINDNDASRKSRVIGYYPTSVRTNISSEPSVIPAPVSPVIDTTPIPIEVPTLSFTKTLFMGVIDPQVQQLQVFLNTHGFPLALSGPGSSGQETTKFGSLTKNAVIKFQIANKITPAIGYVGPVTREVINSLIVN